MHKALIGIATAVGTIASVSWLGCFDTSGGGSIFVPDGGSGSTGSGDSGIPAGKGVGEECDADEEGDCRPGLVCEDGSCQPGHATPEGSPCTISAECEDGLFCGGGVCVPAGDGEEGASCESDADCQSGLRCALSGLSAVCVPEGDTDVFGPCSTSTDCYGGLACLEGECNIAPPGVPPFGLPWVGVECPDPVESGTVDALFRVPRFDGEDGDFFSLPWPNDVRFDAESGHVDNTNFPTPGDDLLGFDIVERYVQAADATRDGWGMYQTVVFRFSGQLNSDTLDANIKVVDLTTGGSSGFFFGYTTGRSKYLCHNRVAVTRGEGRVWEAGHTYAVYFTDGARAKDGSALKVSDDLKALLATATPSDAAVAAHHAKYEPFRQYLADEGIATSSVVNASVFTIGRPQALLEAAQGVVDGREAPAATQWTLCDEGVESPCSQAEGARACGAADSAFHELHALVELPIYQEGSAPYESPDDGGAIKTTSGGAPSEVRTEKVCMALTVPKGGGDFPVVIYGHGTGGHFRNFVANGVAKNLAEGVDDGDGGTVRAAVLSIDAVNHGPRRGDSTGSPDNLVFNFANPGAALGNFQQCAIDQMSLLRFAPTVTFDETGPTGEAFSLTDAVAFWGHSQGATCGALATPWSSAWAGVVFTGQGASLKDSLLTKTSPVNIAGVLPFVLSDFDSDGALPGGSRHPVVNLIQAYIEPADPIAYAGLLGTTPPDGLEARHVFQVYGQKDTYTPSSVQKIYAIAAGLKQVVADGSVTTPDDLGIGATPPPTTGNVTVNGKAVTLGVRQYAPSGAQDGHFVGFDVVSARGDIMRFLGSALRGTAPPQIGE